MHSTHHSFHFESWAPVIPYFSRKLQSITQLPGTKWPPPSRWSVCLFLWAAGVHDQMGLWGGNLSHGKSESCRPGLKTLRQLQSWREGYSFAIHSVPFSWVGLSPSGHERDQDKTKQITVLEGLPVQQFKLGLQGRVKLFALHRLRVWAQGGPGSLQP